MRRVHTAERWPDLERALVAEIDRSRREDPLRPIEMLVGSNLLGVYLRRRLAKRLGALAGVRTLTFLDLGRRLAEPSLWKEGLRPLPALGDLRMIDGVVREMPSRGPFESVRPHRGLRRALLETITDLKEAGWSPQDLLAALEHSGLDEVVSGRIRALAELYRQYQKRLTDAGFYDRSDLLSRAAALAAGEPRSREGAGRDSLFMTSPPSAADEVQASRAESALKDGADQAQAARTGSASIDEADQAQASRAGSAPNDEADQAQASRAESAPNAEAHGEHASLARDTAALYADGTQTAQANGTQVPKADAERSTPADIAPASAADITPASPADIAQASQAGTPAERPAGWRHRDPLLLAYGFYDLIELQWRLFLALAKGRETVVFVPSGPGLAFEYARPLLARLGAEGFEVEQEDSRPAEDGRSREEPSGRSLLGRLLDDLFAEDESRVPASDGRGRSPVERSPAVPVRPAQDDRERERAAVSPADGPSVIVMSAAGEMAEAAEVVRQVLDWAAQGIRFGEMAVLARRFDPHLASVAIELERAGVPQVLAGGSLLQTRRSARAALSLLDLSASDWGREEVLAFMGLAGESGDALESPGTNGASGGSAGIPASGTDVPLAESAEAGRSALSEAGRSALSEAGRSALSEAGRPALSEAGPSRLSAADPPTRLRALVAIGDFLSAHAGIAGGREEWFERLQPWTQPGAERLLPASAKRSFENQPPGEGLHNRARELVRVLRRIEAAIDAWPESGRWSDCARGFAAAVRELLPASADRSAVEQVIEGLGALDATGMCPDRESFADIARIAIDRARIADRRFERDGVLLAEVEAARGLTARAVAMVGIAERAFPSLARQDPLLPDAQRTGLSRAAGRSAPLAIKGFRLPEERMLFRLGAGVARERLLLSWPRLAGGDEAQCLPSPFLMQAAETLGGSVPLRGVSTDDAAGSSAAAFEIRRVPRLPVATSVPSRSLDRAEWLLSELTRRNRTGLLREDDLERLARFDGAPSFLGRSLACERSRWESRLHGAHDGWLDGDVARVARASLLDEEMAVTRMERYARCPRLVLFEHLLGLMPLPDPVGATELPARERGSVMHEILAAFVATLIEEGGSRARLEEANAAELILRLRSVAARELDRLRRRWPALYPVIWEHERSAILADLEAWLAGTLERARRDPYRPVAVEWSFGRAGGEGRPVDVPLAEGTIRFRGRIDRIDLDEQAGAVRVVDYKSGSAAGQSLRRQPDGRQLQLPIYYLAARGWSDAGGGEREVASAEYHFLGGEKPIGLDREVWKELWAGVLTTIRVLAEAIAQGDFTADPRDTRQCSSCDFRAPCGEERARVFQRKRSDPRIARRLALRDA